VLSPMINPALGSPTIQTDYSVPYRRRFIMMFMDAWAPKRSHGGVTPKAEIWPSPMRSNIKRISKS
jgi:hypothetical protein